MLRNYYFLRFNLLVCFLLDTKFKKVKLTFECCGLKLKINRIYQNVVYTKISNVSCEKLVRRIFEMTFEPSNGFRPKYCKNRMEGQKKILYADVKALSIEIF
ncbi:hypothetical protein R3W88_012389 [Solanum pinnatisectum]|uniref:Ribosomal protein L23 n=1 Tax=Solanum pinnatisectum TaxID=50273 RepID=A0AAV9L8V9_9SOLN|nr:hypothetical protein R3W88_012389 [Solanum pinnatisectum]